MQNGGLLQRFFVVGVVTLQDVGAGQPVHAVVALAPKQG